MNAPKPSTSTKFNPSKSAFFGPPMSAFTSPPMSAPTSTPTMGAPTSTSMGAPTSTPMGASKAAPRGTPKKPSKAAPRGTPKKPSNFVLVSYTVQWEDGLTKVYKSCFSADLDNDGLVRCIGKKLAADPSIKRDGINIKKVVVDNTPETRGKWYFVTKIVLINCEKNCYKNFEITRTIFSNSEGSEQFLVTECFFNLFLEGSHI